MSEENSRSAVGFWVLIVVLFAALVTPNFFKVDNFLLSFLKLLKVLSIVGIIIGVILIFATLIKVLFGDINLRFFINIYKSGWYVFWNVTRLKNEESISEIYKRINVIDDILNKNSNLIEEALTLSQKNLENNKNINKV